MKMVFARVRFSSPLPVAVARTSQSPFPLYAILPDHRLNKDTDRNYGIKRNPRNC